MITFDEYQRRMAIIGLPHTTILEYYQYTFCEVKWLEYLQNIFIPNWDPHSHNLRIIIMESCPGPNTNFPHPNYLFNNLHIPINGRRDSYLWQIYRGIINPIPAVPGAITKNDALVQLAEENVLLVDIIPTHQIDLNVPGLRPAVIGSLGLIADFNKVNTLINFLNGSVPRRIKVVTSLGTTYTPVTGIISARIPGSTYFGSMTDTLSHYPSWTLLAGIVHHGF